MMVIIFVTIIFSIQDNSPSNEKILMHELMSTKDLDASIRTQEAESANYNTTRRHYIPD